MIYIEALKKIDLSDYTVPSLFLAGGITGCPDWQEIVVNALQNLSVVIFNPRRKNFPINDPKAGYEQICWEYQALQAVDMVSFWFCKETIQPIVLYEIGSLIHSSKTLFLGVHFEYPRRNDVMIQTKLVRPNLKINDSLESLIEQITEFLHQNEAKTLRVRAKKEKAAAEEDEKWKKNYHNENFTY